MPRSGTSFLHNLLQQDPQFRAPRQWELELELELVVGW
jgi:hypothetical protein